MGYLLGFVILTSIWVLIDAQAIGVKKGQVQGMGNMGPWGWFFACLLIWIIGFPFYLAKRSEFKRINSSLSSGGQGIVVGPPQRKKGLSAIHWVGIILIVGIAWLALFGQREDGTTGISRLASSGKTNYVIKVRGSPGLIFSGAYMVVTSSGSKSHSVEGIVPATYSVSGNMVSAEFQKQSSGIQKLVVSIEVNGRTKQQSSTYASYGVVSVASK